MHDKPDFSLIEVKLEYDDLHFERKLEHDIVIGPDLEEEFNRQAEVFAWWATVAELAKDQVAKEKYRIDRLYALLDQQVRKDFHEKKIKFTEKMVEASIITHEDYQKAMLDFFELKKQLGMLEASKIALCQKKDMLIQRGANSRADWTSSPVILKKAARDTEREKQAERKKPIRRVGKK